MADLVVGDVPAAMLEALVELEAKGLVECAGGLWRLTEAGRAAGDAARLFDKIEATRRDPYGRDSLDAWGVRPPGLRRALANVRARR